MTSNERILQPFYFTKWYRAEKPFALAPMTTCTDFSMAPSPSSWWSTTARAPEASIPLLSVLL